MKFDKYILWSQSDAPTVDDYVLIDGMQVNGDMRQQAFEFLSISLNPVIKGKRHIWKEAKIDDKINKFKSKTGEVTSPSLSFYTDNFQNVLIKSHYESVDLAGRHIAFMFCVSPSYSNNVSTILKEASSEIQRVCKISDLHFIEKELNLKKKKCNYVNIILFIIFLTAIIWLIVKNY